MIGTAVSLVRDRHGEGNPRRQYPLENDMEQKKLNYFIIYAKSLAMLLLLLLIFYWAAGEQLFYRESAGNRDGGYGNCITGELADGIWIDQYFDAQTDKVESVGVLLTSNGKEIRSDVQITLTDMATGMDLASEIVSADAIAVNEYHYLEFEEGVISIIDDKCPSYSLPIGRVWRGKAGTGAIYGKKGRLHYGQQADSTNTKNPKGIPFGCFKRNGKQSPAVHKIRHRRGVQYADKLCTQRAGAVPDAAIGGGLGLHCGKRGGVSAQRPLVLLLEQPLRVHHAGWGKEVCPQSSAEDIYFIRFHRNRPE